MFNFLHNIGSAVYPPRCVSCDVYIEQSDFCDSCRDELARLADFPTCPQCAFPTGPAGACPNCEGRGIAPFAQIVALGPYRDPLKRMIHHMKYSRRWSLAETLADEMLNHDRIRQLIASADCLVPIPLYWSRHIDRGYNQSDLLARRMAGKSIPVVKALSRKRNTPTQTTFHAKAQRIDNMRDAFQVTNSRSIFGRRIVLVDDVMTTAATLKSAAKTLHSLAPAELSAIVIATGDPRRQDFQTI